MNSITRAEFSWLQHLAGTDLQSEKSTLPLSFQFISWTGAPWLKFPLRGVFHKIIYLFALANQSTPYGTREHGSKTEGLVIWTTKLLNSYSKNLPRKEKVLFFFLATEFLYILQRDLDNLVDYNFDPGDTTCPDFRVDLKKVQEVFVLILSATKIMAKIPSYQEIIGLNSKWFPKVDPTFNSLIATMKKLKIRSDVWKYYDGQESFSTEHFILQLVVIEAMGSGLNDLSEEMLDSIYGFKELAQMFLMFGRPVAACCGGPF